VSFGKNVLKIGNNAFDGDIVIRMRLTDEGDMGKIDIAIRKMVK
jgi:hypothetical protein